MSVEQFKIFIRITQLLFPRWVARLLRKKFLECHPVQRQSEELIAWASFEVLQLPSKRSLRRSTAAFSKNDEVGSSGHAPHLLFIHGWESRGSAFYKWKKVCDEFGVNMLMWDAPLHGDSPPLNSKTETNLIEICRAIKEDLQSIDLNIVGYVGHSLGGMVLLLSQNQGWIPQKPTVTVGSPAQSKIVMDRFLDLFDVSHKVRQMFFEILSEDIGFNIEDTQLLKEKFSSRFRHLGIHDRADKEVPFKDLEKLVASTGGQKLETEGLGHRRILRDEALASKAVNFLRT